MGIIGYKASEETKEKMRLSHLGRKMSDESRKKLSQSKLGVSQGPCTDERRENVRKANLGKKRSIESRENIRKASTGRKMSAEAIEKSRKANMGNTHHKGHFWPEWRKKSRATPVEFRYTYENRAWRKAVYKRDNFTCQKTGQRGGKLQAHHILSFADNVELRYEVNNGITLTKEAHQNFHDIYGRGNNTKEQLEEYLGKPVPTWPESYGHAQK